MRRPVTPQGGDTYPKRGHIKLVLLTHRGSQPNVKTYDGGLVARSVAQQIDAGSACSAKPQETIISGPIRSWLEA